MKNRGRWPLAVAALAIFGWACQRTPPGNAPAAAARPSAEAKPGPVGASDRPTFVHLTSTLRALPSRQDWVARFHAAGSNYFEFVTRAVPM